MHAPVYPLLGALLWGLATAGLTRCKIPVSLLITSSDRAPGGCSPTKGRGSPQQAQISWLWDVIWRYGSDRFVLQWLSTTRILRWKLVNTKSVIFRCVTSGPSDYKIPKITPNSSSPRKGQIVCRPMPSFVLLHRTQFICSPKPGDENIHKLAGR